jgi:hypothetical protein
LGKILFNAKLKPSAYLQRMLKHQNVSESSKHKVIAVRSILNHTVTFYADGIRTVDNLDLTEQEFHDSEILRFAHASILINEAVGDKKACYVDATKNPAEVWVYNKKLF